MSFDAPAPMRTCLTPSTTCLSAPAGGVMVTRVVAHAPRSVLNASVDGRSRGSAIVRSYRGQVRRSNTYRFVRFSEPVCAGLSDFRRVHFSQPRKSRGFRLAPRLLSKQLRRRVMALLFAIAFALFQGA